MLEFELDVASGGRLHGLLGVVVEVVDSQAAVADGRALRGRPIGHEHVATVDAADGCIRVGRVVQDEDVLAFGRAWELMGASCSLPDARRN